MKKNILMSSCLILNLFASVDAEAFNITGRSTTTTPPTNRGSGTTTSGRGTTTSGTTTSGRPRIVITRPKGDGMSASQLQASCRSTQLVRSDFSSEQKFQQYKRTCSATVASTTTGQRPTLIIPGTRPTATTGTGATSTTTTSGPRPRVSRSAPTPSAPIIIRPPLGTSILPKRPERVVATATPTTVNKVLPTILRAPASTTTKPVFKIGQNKAGNGPTKVAVGPFTKAATKPATAGTTNQPANAGTKAKGPGFANIGAVAVNNQNLASSGGNFGSISANNSNSALNKNAGNFNSNSNAVAQLNEADMQKATTYINQENELYYNTLESDIQNCDRIFQSAKDKPNSAKGYTNRGLVGVQNCCNKRDVYLSTKYKDSLNQILDDESKQLLKELETGYSIKGLTLLQDNNGAVIDNVEEWANTPPVPPSYTTQQKGNSVTVKRIDPNSLVYAAKLKENLLKVMEPGNQLGGADAQIKYLSEAFRSKNNKAQKDINTVKNKLATTVSKLKKIKISMQKAKAQLPREANAQQAGGYQTSASIQSSPVTQFGKMDSAKNNIEDFCDEVENNIKKFSLTDTGKAKPIGHSSQTPAMGNSLKKDTKLKSNRVPSSLR